MSDGYARLWPCDLEAITAWVERVAVVLEQVNHRLDRIETKVEIDCKALMPVPGPFGGYPENPDWYPGHIRRLKQIENRT